MEIGKGIYLGILMAVALYEKIQKMNPEYTVEVGIWLSPIKDDTPKPEPGSSEKEYNEMLAAKRRAYAEKEKPVIDRLKKMNITIRYASQYAPLIYAEVPVKLMAEVENISDVGGIYLAREFQPMMDKVAQTVKVQPVWNAGITGSGIKVAVVEQGRYTTQNPYLAVGPSYNSSGVVSSHVTQVAGIIASTHSTYKGISYGVPGLLSANAGSWQEADMIAASEWAINNGANILSNSWGNDTYSVLSGIDRYYDHVVWNHWRTVTVSAGNNEAGENWRVLSPGLGYNVITVGGFDDKDTSTWSDDTMWANSAFVDPISQNGDREKPEVVAVATHGSRTITSTYIADPWVHPVVAAGTSYAAPAVAGEAALLMQAKSWLTSWPETVKAVIMASADHNLEGNSMLSEYDGAGGIDILKAYETAYNNRMSGDVLYSNDFPRDYTFSASVGQKVRVAVTWDSHPDNNHPPSSDPLESDIDLYILDPNGRTVAFSTSYDNNYEIVEFTAAMTGTYTARVRAYRFDGAYEYLGFAYTYA